MPCPTISGNEIQPTESAAVPERIIEEATRLFMAILTANLDRIGSLIQAARQRGATTREEAMDLMVNVFFDGLAR
jgi:hypothetical protein